MRTRRFPAALGVILPIIVLSLLLPLEMAAAQKSDTEAPSPKHSLRDGAWALQFGLPAFSRGGYNDPELSIKYHLSDRGALRIGMEIEGVISFGNSDNYRGEDEPDSMINYTEFDTDRQGFRLDLQYTSYGPSTSNLHLFWGAGPLIDFFRGKEKSESVSYGYYGQRRTSVEYNSTQWAFGLSGAIGAEWFLSTRVSLVAEYGISLEYRYYTRESNAVSYYYEESYSRNKYHNNSFDLDLRESKIALSVYL